MKHLTPMHTIVTRVLTPPPGLSRALILQSLNWAVGEGIFLTASPIFFLKHTKISPTQVGLGLSVAALVRLATRIPLGMMADRLGGRRSWIIASLTLSILYGCYPLVRGFAPFVIVVTIVALATGMGCAGRGKYLGDTLPSDTRVRAQAFMRSLANVGFTVAAAAAAAALATGTSSAYVLLVLGTAAAYLIECGLLAWCVPGVQAPVKTPPNTRQRIVALRDRGALALSAMNGIIASSDTILLVVLPLWILTNTDAPPTAIPALFACNTVLTVLLQTTAAKGSEELPGAARAQRHSAFLLAASCLLLALSQSYSRHSTLLVLSIAVTALTLSEIMGEAGFWGLSYGLSPPAQRAEYLAVFGLGSDAARVIGPGVFTYLTLGHPHVGWYALAFAFIVAGLAVSPVARLAGITATRELAAAQPGLQRQ